MRAIAILLIVSLCSCAAAPKPKHALNFYGGVRSLNDSSFDEANDQTTYGVDGLLGLTKGGLGIEGGYLRSDSKGDISAISTEVTTDEFFVGLRQTFLADGKIQPYIAGGATWLDTKAEQTSGSGTDTSPAAYARTGVGFVLGWFQLGIDGRATFGSNMDLDGTEVNVDSLQVLGFLGVTF